MRIKEIPYREVLADDSTNEPEEDLIAAMHSLGLPLVTAEMKLVTHRFQKKGRVNVPAMIAELESMSGEGDASGRNRGKDGESFGKELFKKLCLVRSKYDKAHEFRKSLIGKDAELVGHVNRRDLQRAVDHSLDLTDAESALLSENLCFSDGTHANDLDYSFLLLILFEPISKVPLEAGTAIMNSMLRGADAVSLRRLLALLFRNFAAYDSRCTGKNEYNIANCQKKIFPSLCIYV